MFWIGPVKVNINMTNIKNKYGIKMLWIGPVKVNIKMTNKQNMMIFLHVIVMQLSLIKLLWIEPVKVNINMTNT